MEAKGLVETATTTSYIATSIVKINAAVVSLTKVDLVITKSFKLRI